MRTAVILTTYNRPDALSAALAGYAAQGDLDFELIVADDGSTEATRELIAPFAKNVAFPVKHVWHEDLGFRAAAIRNRAIAATEAEYLIFSDGDCVPAAQFVAQHKRLARAGWFVAGNRILLSAAFTRRVLENKLPIHSWAAGKWIAAWARGDINRLLPLIMLPDWQQRTASPQRWEGVKTCNLGVWREDASRINGLDESYAGWGLEDSDFVVRLLHAGVQHKNGRFAAPLFHLWHSENDRSRLDANQQRLQELLHSDRIEAAVGLDQYQ